MKKACCQSKAKVTDKQEEDCNDHTASNMALINNDETTNITVLQASTLVGEQIPEAIPDLIHKEDEQETPRAYYSGKFKENESSLPPIHVPRNNEWIQEE